MYTWMQRRDVPEWWWELLGTAHFQVFTDEMWFISNDGSRHHILTSHAGHDRHESIKKFVFLVIR